MRNEPIFVVGVGRSGTTLLAAMLAAHSRLSCGSETHFFRRLSEIDPRSLCDRTTWPRPAVEFLASIRPTGIQSGRPEALLEQYQIEGREVETFLAEREPSIAAILASVTEQFMRARGKQRWVEKTPHHLMDGAAIRAAFPRSPIIRIVRDPRDVALSLMKVPWGARTFFEAILYWERIHRAGVDFFAADRLSYTLRFEDLLAAPVEQLRKTCSFIGEEFEDRMLDTSRTGAEVNGENAPWKRKAGEAVDVGRVAVWRSVLTARENRLAEAIVGDQLAAFGYPREGTFSHVAAIHPDFTLAARHADAFESVAADGVRFWKTMPGEQAAVHVFLGEPGSVAWLGKGRLERFSSAIPIVTAVMKASFGRARVYWIRDEGQGAWTGWLALVLRRLLQRHEVNVNARAGGGYLPSDRPAAALERQNLG
jgi:hypothetical protein